MNGICNWNVSEMFPFVFRKTDAILHRRTILHRIMVSNTSTEKRESVSAVDARLRKIGSLSLKKTCFALDCSKYSFYSVFDLQISPTCASLIASGGLWRSAVFGRCQKVTSKNNSTMMRARGKNYFSLTAAQNDANVDTTTVGLEGNSSEILAAISSLRQEVQAKADDTSPAPEREPPTVLPEIQSPGSGEELKNQLAELSETILETKRELASLNDPTAGSTNDVEAATLELGAVVGATEAATNDIMSAAELIDDLAGRLKSQASNHNDETLAEEIIEKVVNIFEACNFQDITGQRITKVVNTLNFIDERVGKMMTLWGAKQQEAPEREVEGDDGLLNGPSLDGQGASQNDIDALFD